MSTSLRRRRLLAEALHLDESDVRPDSSLAQLFAQYGSDSLDRVEFLMRAEEEFSELEIPDGVAETWGEWIQAMTVQQLADFIDDRQHN